MPCHLCEVLTSIGRLILCSSTFTSMQLHVRFRLFCLHAFYRVQCQTCMKPDIATSAKTA